MKNKLIIISLVLLALFSIGCINKIESNKGSTPDSLNTSVPIQTISNDNIDEKETIKNMESNIKTLESRIDELEKTIQYNGMMKASNKNLIPAPPFAIIVLFKNNMTYYFNQDGSVEITKDVIPIKAYYEIYSNNTIKIFSKNNSVGVGFVDNNFDFFRLRLFDNYIVSTYDNGWIDWVAEYKIETNSTSKWSQHG